MPFEKEFFMILKFETVPSVCFVTLVAFVHSKENIFPEVKTKRNMVVRFMEIKPSLDPSDDAKYGITLQILEWYSTSEECPKQVHIDPKYLLKVYEILGQAPHLLRSVR
jgi:hypothetical protein